MTPRWGGVMTPRRGGVKEIFRLRANFSPTPPPRNLSTPPRLQIPGNNSAYS